MPPYQNQGVVGDLSTSRNSVVDTRRRSLLKLSPFAIATAVTTIGHTSFAEAPEIATAGTFNVRTYGATGDGKTMSTRPLSTRAIETVAASGWRHAPLPMPGIYVCFTIHLRSNVALYLSQGLH